MKAQLKPRDRRDALFSQSGNIAIGRKTAPHRVVLVQKIEFEAFTFTRLSEEIDTAEAEGFSLPTSAAISMLSNQSGR